MCKLNNVNSLMAKRNDIIKLHMKKHREKRRQDESEDEEYKQSLVKAQSELSLKKSQKKRSKLIQVSQVPNNQTSLENISPPGEISSSQKLHVEQPAAPKKLTLSFLKSEVGVLISV